MEGVKFEKTFFQFYAQGQYDEMAKRRLIIDAIHHLLECAFVWPILGRCAQWAEKDYRVMLRMIITLKGRGVCP